MGHAEPLAMLEELGALISPSWDAYTGGEIEASQIVCALCEKCPCSCPKFGTPEYFELIKRRHGK